MSHLAQLNNQVTIAVQEQLTVDGQGKPTYAAATDLVVQRVQYHSPIGGMRSHDKTLISMPDGTQERAAITLFIDASVTPVPGLKAKITLAGRAYIVLAVGPFHDLDNVLHHTKVACKTQTP